MARLSRLPPVLGALLSCSSATPTLDDVSHRNARAEAAATTPVPPSRDPWYTAPPGFENAAPGAVLRTRVAPGNLTSIVGNSSVAYNVLFRTTDSQYNPTWAVTTLFVPESKQAGEALLSYQIGYDSADIDASPSYAFYGGGVLADIPNALGMGWFVSIPDFEGPLASFTAGVMSGHATIDSVRAVLDRRFGISSQARYAMWGYSGGALASEWAAELQVQYAPELTFAGAALGGLPPNITSVLLAVTGTISAGLAPPAILGLTSQFPDVRAYVLSQLKTSGPYNATTFLDAAKETFVQTKVAFAFQNIADYFVDGFASLLVPQMQKILDSDGMMGYHGVPAIPLFVYKAINDEVSPVADTDALVARYCGIGADILYQRNTVGGHEAESANGDPAAFEFLASVLGGTYTATAGCAVQNVTVAISTSPLKKRLGEWVS